jgi:hypothetical protein
MWGRRGGIAIGTVVFSHWVLDLIVHRADLPILPGNLGHLPLLGFGLWKSPTVSLSLEGALCVFGLVMYFLSIVPGTRGGQRRMAMISVGVLGIFLTLATVSSILGWA